MDRGIWRRFVLPLLIFAGVWMGLRYLLPILLPFVFGGIFALMAEPGVQFLEKRLLWRRRTASVIAVAGLFLMIATLVWLLGAVAYREVSLLAAGLPQALEEVTATAQQVRSWAMGVVSRAPASIATGLRRSIGELFAGGSVLLERAATGLLGAAGALMGGIPGGALLVGTAVLSTFMISAQLPALKSGLRRRFSKEKLKKWLDMTQRIGHTALSWLKAQLKLSGITFTIVLAGFFLLRVQNPLFWAVVTALVDAVPMLGTGIILIPWSLISLALGRQALAVGLIGLCVTAMVTRSMLEPKLLGRQLGMNPLLTLIALYAGYRLWGVTGMILAPVLTVTARQIVGMKEEH